MAIRETLFAIDVGLAFCRISLEVSCLTGATVMQLMDGHTFIYIYLKERMWDTGLEVTLWLALTPSVRFEVRLYLRIRWSRTGLS